MRLDSKTKLSNSSDFTEGPWPILSKLLSKPRNSLLPRQPRNLPPQSVPSQDYTRDSIIEIPDPTNPEPQPVPSLVAAGRSVRFEYSESESELESKPEKKRKKNKKMQLILSR